MIVWYVLSALHFFFLLVANGKWADYGFGASTKVTLIYLLCGFGFVLVDCAIIWGLSAKGISYGPMYPWAFCWIRTNTFYVLGFSFYVPALIAVVASLVFSIACIVHILRVRMSLQKIDSETVSAVFAIFACTNIGTVGFCCLGLFVILSRDASAGSPGLFIAMGALLLLQALVFWFVYFARRSNMEMWRRIFFCDGFKEMQEPGFRFPVTPKGSTGTSTNSATKLRGASSTSSSSPTSSNHSGAVEL